LAEEDGQTWSKTSARGRQAGKNAIRVEQGDKTLDALLVRADNAREGGDLLQQTLYTQGLRFNHPAISG